MRHEATDRSPLVDFNEEEGKLIIKGRSVHENAESFYAPIYDAIESFLGRQPDRMDAEFDLIYFNSSSSKYFLDILRSMESAAQRGRTKVSVLWKYEKDDLDMKEAGNDYRGLLKVPFKLKAR